MKDASPALKPCDRPKLFRVTIKDVYCYTIGFDLIKAPLLPLPESGLVVHVLALELPQLSK